MTWRGHNSQCQAEAQQQQQKQEQRQLWIIFKNQSAKLYKMTTAAGRRERDTERERDLPAHSVGSEKRQGSVK